MKDDNRPARFGFNCGRNRRVIALQKIGEAVSPKLIGVSRHVADIEIRDTPSIGLVYGAI